MNKRELLLTRLDEIGHAIEKSAHGLAVIGLGSAGCELHRLDDYSDLDFFVIAEDGCKQRYIDNLDWLSSIAPVVYQFRNTTDGYKVLFQDDVFCEFAVFEYAELQHIPFAPGRIIWKRPDVDASISVPANVAHSSGGRTTDWLLGEALTNLYVGLCRYRRGEKLSAARFVQQFAVDRLIELCELQSKKPPGDKDPFSNERRLEKRYPEFASQLPLFVQGYERTPESAQAILNYLSRAYVVNRPIASAILRLCGTTVDNSNVAAQQ